MYINMWRKMNIMWNWQNRRDHTSWPHFFFFTGKQKYDGSQINFPCSSVYLIHDAKDDLHYQVTTFSLRYNSCVIYLYCLYIVHTCFSSNI